MKRTLIQAALLIGVSLSPAAGINSPTAGGAIDRARAMYSQGNYAGCLDRLALADFSQLTPTEREGVEWLRANAAYRSGAEEAKEVLEKFLENYPASVYRLEAKMRIADCLLESRPGEALELYDEIDPRALSAGLAEDWCYHRGYALLRLGELSEARESFAQLTKSKEFGANAAFYLGYIAYTERNYTDAKTYFARANRSCKPGIDADYYLAQIYYMEGDYKKALDTAQSLLARNNASPAFTAEANRIAGESLFNQGKESKALPYLRTYADTAETPELSALYMLGMSEYRLGHYDEAVKRLEAVTESQSAMGQSAYYYIGESLLADGNKDAALMAFDKALRLDFDLDVQEAAYYSYAVAKFDGASMPFDSAASTFEEFLRRYPNGRYTAQVQEYLVNGYLTDHNYDAALASINRMSNPGTKVMAAKQQILYALGNRALSTGDAASAKNYLTQSRQLSAYSATIAAQAALPLGEAEYRLGNYGEAANDINAYLNGTSTSDANRSLAWYDLGYAYFANKQYSKAGEAFTKFVNNSGSLGSAAVADGYNRLGDVSLYSSDFTTARSRYQKAIEIQPESADYPMFQKAVIRGYERDHKGKIADLNNLISEFPTSSLVPDALLEMTESYIQLHDNTSAIATYRRLVNAYPNTEQGRRGYLQMAMTQLNNGDRKGAIESYRQVVKLYPTSEEAQMAVDELKRISAEDGTLTEFTSFLASVENAPKLEVGEADQLTFEAAEKDYLTSQSTKRLQSYVEQYPDGAYRSSAWGYLMENADNNGKSSEALKYANLIIENYGDSRLAESALIVKANSEYQLGRGEDALRSWTTLESRASSPAVINTARVGIMRVARDVADYQRVVDASNALLSSSTLGAEDRNEATFSRAVAYDALGKTSEARKDWSSLAGDTDDLWGAKSSYYLAESYYNGGNLDKATTQVQKLIDSATPHTYWLARGFILLSDIYAKQGKKFEAREYLRSLRENYPGTETDIFQMIDTRLNNLK